MDEKDKRTLERARKLRVITQAEGWNVMVAYVLARANGLKNRLARINLTEKLSEAMKTQGEIEGINSVINWVTNEIQVAKLIEEKEKK